MSYRWNAAIALTKRRVFETFLSPGFYIAVASGLLVSTVLVSGFTSSVDSSGLNFSLNPAYELIARSFAGIFGSTFVVKLFSEGPFLFIFHVAFLPFLLYLSLNAVYRFGFEKSAGAMELIMYGPADGTSCFISFLLRNLLLTVLYSAILLLFFGILSVLSNLVLGPQFFYSFFMMFLLTLAVYSYGIFSSVISENALAGIALFTGILILFVLVEIGSFTISSGYVKNVSTVAAMLVNWISPLFYWSSGLSNIEYGYVGGYLFNMLLLVALSVVLLVSSHLLVRNRGARA